MINSKLQFKIQNFKLLIAILIFTFYILNFMGCVVRTYPVTKDRVDQDLTAGNRGYIQGELPASAEVKERKEKRTVQTVEIELFAPIKFETEPKSKAKPTKETIIEESADRRIWGNRGFITRTYVSEPQVQEPVISSPSVRMEKYTVKKGDTLQKISQNFYGTSKKWMKIYEANKDTLKAPDKIYPGQVLNIPGEPLKETKENLK